MWWRDGSTCLYSNHELEHGTFMNYMFASYILNNKSRHKKPMTGYPIDISSITIHSQCCTFIYEFTFQIIIIKLFCHIQRVKKWRTFGSLQKQNIFSKVTNKKNDILSVINDNFCISSIIGLNLGKYSTPRFKYIDWLISSMSNDNYRKGYYKNTRSKCTL